MGSAVVREMLRASPADATDEWRRYYAQMVYDLFEIDTGRYATNCEELRQWMLSPEGLAILAPHRLRCVP